jgi:hypothetical protein
MTSVDGASRVMLGLAAILAVMGLAGLSSTSFAYDLMFGLAILFGAAAGLSLIATKNSRARALLFTLVIVLAVIATYMYVVSRGGGAPGSKPTLTPWMPIAIALLAMTGAGLLARRVTRNPTVGVSTALVVMAVILAVFAQIATVAYIPAALLALMALVGFGSAGLHGARGRNRRNSIP